MKAVAEVISCMWVVGCVLFSSTYFSPDVAASDFSGGWEVQQQPLTPDEAEASQELVDELFANYLDCIQMTGLDEDCYWRWKAKCEGYFGETYCSWLEEEMVPAPDDGDESC